MLVIELLIIWLLYELSSLIPLYPISCIFESLIILSSFDSDNSQSGSSVYVPYRASGEATTTPVLDWLGSNLAVTIDSSFGGVKNFNTGEPGLYYEDNYAASIIAITDGDSDYLQYKIVFGTDVSFTGTTQTFDQSVSLQHGKKRSDWKM